MSMCDGILYTVTDKWAKTTMTLQILIIRTVANGCCAFRSSLCYSLTVSALSCHVSKPVKCMSCVTLAFLASVSLLFLPLHTVALQYSTYTQVFPQPPSVPSVPECLCSVGKSTATQPDTQLVLYSQCFHEKSNHWLFLVNAVIMRLHYHQRQGQT